MIKFQCEPARIVALFTAALTTAVAFGLNLTPEQTTALLALATVVLGAGEVTRSAVVPTVKHDAAVTEALYTPVPEEETS